MLTRVLVVDPEKTVADAAAMLLAARGSTTRAVYNAKDAMALATEFKPHALVSDARLPGMDGAELAEWFTQNMPMCKVVLISFNPSMRFRAEEVMRRGHIAAFISKKEDLGELLVFLSRIKPQE
jgi:DNA-binding NtrC family response regulator